MKIVRSQPVEPVTDDFPDDCTYHRENDIKRSRQIETAEHEIALLNKNQLQVPQVLVSDGTTVPREVMHVLPRVCQAVIAAL